MTGPGELRLLNSINSPRDLAKLNNDQLDSLADEIRRYLVSVVSKNGGHLASNLGVVETTIALHKVFDFKNDRLILDVGHQCYVHKLLTGRREGFEDLRKRGGIAGFPKTTESEYDAFNTGHSSTSVSAAIGIMRSDALAGRKRSVVALIGDGALTGGMAYEALDDVGQQQLPLIVVLNDNEMSISGNVGGMSRHLARVRSGRRYRGFKKRFSRALKKIPLIGKRLSSGLEGLKNRIKYFVLPNVLFEELGFTYLGPINGHDISALTEVFEHAKHMDKPVVIHVITHKGKGYEPAERNPEKFHGIGKFDEKTGECVSKPGNSAIFAEELCRLAGENEKLVAITAAMTSGTGLEAFKKLYPERFFDVGIAEQHAVTMAAGMAISGSLPVFCVYSSFLQRAYDQLLHDVCLQGLKVIIGVDRAGLVGADGETHHGIYDIAYMLSLPGMTLFSPSSEQELRLCLDTAVGSCAGPCAVRYNRGRLPSREVLCGDMFRWEFVRPVSVVSVVVTGRLAETVINAAEGLPVGVCIARVIRPADESALDKLLTSRIVVTVEDGVVDSGFGVHVAAYAAEHGSGCRIINLGVPNRIIEQGTVAQQDEECGIDEAGVRSLLEELLQMDRGVRSAEAQDGKAS